MKRNRNFNTLVEDFVATHGGEVSMCELKKFLESRGVKNATQRVHNMVNSKSCTVERVSVVRFKEGFEWLS